MNKPRPLSHRVSWDDLTEDERRFYEKQGWAPYDRSQDPTAEEMRPIYAARGYQREPDPVRGSWDNETDEQYAQHWRHYTPAQLVASSRDIRCTDPDTLDRAAAIMVAALQRRERDRAAGIPDPPPHGSVWYP